MRKKIIALLLIVLIFVTSLLAAGSVKKLQDFPSMDYFYSFYDGDVLPPPLAMSTYSITNWDDYCMFCIKYSDFLPEDFVTYDMLRSFGEFVGVAFTTDGSSYMYVVQPKGGRLLRISITHTLPTQAKRLANTLPIGQYPSLPNLSYFNVEDLPSTNTQQSANALSVSFVNKDAKYIYKYHRTSTYRLGIINIQFNGTSISFRDHLFDDVGLSAWADSTKLSDSLVSRLQDRNTADGAVAQLETTITFNQSLPLLLRFRAPWIVLSLLFLAGISTTVVFVILRRKRRKQADQAPAICSCVETEPPT